MYSIFWARRVGSRRAQFERVKATQVALRVRIPMKWGTDSGGSGAASEQAALVTVMISEAPHFSQEFCE